MRTGSSRLGIVLLALAGSAAPALTQPALAQPALAPSPREAAMTARYERLTRRLEAESRIEPGSAAREAAQLRRRLITENNGVNFSPDESRLSARLEEVQKKAPPPAPGQRVGPDPLARDQGLPASYDLKAKGASSVRREVRLVTRLLDRADLGLREKRSTQAQSDLSAAEQSLAALTEVVPEAELNPLAERFGQLLRRVEAAPAEPPAADEGIDDDLAELEENPTQPGPTGSLDQPPPRSEFREPRPASDHLQPRRGSDG